MDKVRSVMKSQSSAGKLSTAKKSVMYLGDPDENVNEKSQEWKPKVAQPSVNAVKVSAFKWLQVSISMHAL